MRASAFAPEVSRLLGVRVGAHAHARLDARPAVGALAAMLMVPTELGLNPHSTDLLFVLAFTAAVVGGLDCLSARWIGGLVVGIASA